MSRRRRTSGIALLCGLALVAVLVLTEQKSEPVPATVASAPARDRQAPAPASQDPARDRAVPSLETKPVKGPSFAIVRLRRGLSAPLHAAPDGRVARTLGPRTEFGSRIVLAVGKRRPGWLGVLTPKLANGRVGWLRLDPARMSVYWTKYSIGVDLSRLRLALRYGDKQVASFPVSIGAPGHETPTGRFAVTDAINFDQSPYYGCCALALNGHQPKLPPGWLGGDRIAIHGTAGPVGEAASSGCLRATDQTMRFLFDRLPLGTPVFVSQ